MSADLEPSSREEIDSAVAWTERMIAATRGRSMAEVRDYIDAIRASSPLPPHVSVTPVSEDGARGLWLASPAWRTDRTIVYFHGGGFQFGSPASHADAAAHISDAARANTFLVEYRRAPEHRFPTPVEDCARAYEWLLTRGDDPHKVAFAGDSAGGNLVVTTLLLCRERGLPLPAAAVCLSPWVNLVCDGETIVTLKSIDPSGETDSLGDNVRAYLGTADPRLPLASPVYADLTGLPPLLVQVGTREILLDDSRRLAQRARECGVPVTLEEWPGMIHNWHMLTHLLRDAVRANARIGAFIDAAWAAADGR